MPPLGLLNTAARTGTAARALAHGSAAEAERIVIVGSGVAGKYAAIRAANAGFNVTVVERFPEIATRKTLFNLAPSVMDELTRLDGGGDGITKVISPIVERFTLRSQTADEAAAMGVKAGEVLERNSQSVLSSRMLPDPNRPATAEGLVAGFKGEDRRPWGRVTIEGIENHMREYAKARFGNQIEWRFNTGVDSVEQSAEGVIAHTTDKAGVKDTIKGSWLISTTGGRNVLGIKRDMFPDRAHYVGGLLTPVRPDQVIQPRSFIDGAHFDPATHVLNPPGKTWSSVGLPWDQTHGLMWAQVSHDATGMDQGLLRKVVNERIKAAGVAGEILPGEQSVPIVNVQLGMLRNESAVQGRVILAGDELLAPYFPTSTGAGHAFSANGPLVGNLLDELAKGGNNEAALQTYATEARNAAELVLKESRAQMLKDLNLPVPEWSVDVRENLGRVAQDLSQAAP